MMATKRSLKNMGRRGLSLFMAMVMTLSLIQISAFAANPDYSDRVNNPDPQYQYALAEGDNKNATEANHDVKISKTAAATNVENEFEITLTVNSKDRVVESEEVVGADIVLVFDLSSSMDGSNWDSLKSSASTFIDRMLDADSSGQNRISIVAYSRYYATLQEWTSNASTAKGTYENYKSASGLNDDLDLSDGTNCQAGFYAADQMLKSARDEALTYVVYMSDGEANSYYAELNCDRWLHDKDCYKITTDVANADIVFADNSYTAEGASAAKQQAAVLKANHPNAKIITVGLGTGSNAVLDPNHMKAVVVTPGYWDCSKWWHEHSKKKGCTWVPAVTEDVADGNTAVDEFHSGSTDSIKSIYDSIATQIVLESDPWMVTDHMSDYVEFIPNSVTGSKNVTMEDGILKWDLEADANGSSKKSFTISYRVRLKDTENTSTSLWGYDESGEAIWHPTNGDTVLAYKVVKNNVTYPTRTVEFAVPEVRAETHTVTLKHVVDGTERTSETFTRLGGYQIDLDGEIKTYGQGVQYTGRDQFNGDGASFTMGSDTATDNVITYNYITGYQVTINYLDQDSNQPVASAYSQAHANGSVFSVNSPAVDGYKLVSSDTSTISGTVNGADVTVNVLYTKESYSVTYEFEGETPDDVTVPVDNHPYDLFNNNEATVQGVTAPTGWTFEGWTLKGGDGTIYSKDDSLTITGNMTLVGTWEKISYELDIVYQLDQTAYDAYLNELAPAEEKLANVVLEEIDEAEYTDIEGVLDEATYNAAVQQAEGDYNAAVQKAEDEIAAVKAKWAIGEKVDSYTANNGTTYTTDTEAGTYFFTQTDGGVYHVDSTTTVNAIDPGSDFKVTPEKNEISFASGENQTAFFAISNDLFSVTVVHHYVKGSAESTETVGPVALNAGSAYTVSLRDKAGYEFDENNVGNDAEPGEVITMGENDLIIDLYYQAIPYTVTFTFEGEEGHNVAQPEDQAKYVDEYAIAPNVIAPAGWAFDGWYTKDADGNHAAYDFNTPIAGNVDLYGAWSQLTYVVDFKFTGDVPTDAKVPDPQSGLHYNATAPDPSYSYTNNDDSKVYTFDGWYVSGSSTKYDFNTPVTGDLTLYGRFTAQTAKYGYVVEYYLDGMKKGSLDSVTAVNYHSAVSADIVESSYSSTAKTALSNEPGNPYLSLSEVTGIDSIGAIASENVAKLYFTTDTFTLTINYWYYPNGSTTPVKVPESMISTNPYVDNTLIHGESYSKTSPGISHYYLRDSEDSTISGTINGQSVTEDVYYLEHSKYTVTVEYYDIADKDNAEATQIATAATLHFYEDETGSVGTELTSGKNITNYTYAETDGATTGITGAATIKVYFTRDTANVVVEHRDASKGGELIGLANEAIYNVGDAYRTEPLPRDGIKLPSDYKLVSYSATSSLGEGGSATTFDASGNGSGTAATKDETITVVYTYDLKGNANVTVNYILVDVEGNIIRPLANNTTSHKEGDSYDVTSAIEAFETANAQYTRKETNGDPISGTLKKDDSKTINVYYTLNSYTFTVEYYRDSISAENLLDSTSATAPYGAVLTEELVGNYLGNSSWLNAQRPAGYNRTNATYVTVSDDAAANVVNVVYTRVNEGGGGTTTNYYYQVNTQYTAYDAEGNEIYSDSVTGAVQSTGSSTYTLTSADTATRGNYTFALTSGQSQVGDLSGTSRANPYVFTVTYEFTEIGDIDTPTGELPTDPTGPIDPADPTGTTDPSESDELDIADPEVPLAEVPNTGDSLALWIMAAAVSGMSLVWLVLSGKKRKDEEV